MKNIVLSVIAIFLFISFTNAQIFGKDEEKIELPIDPETHMVSYTETVDADTSADRLMERALVWVEHYYKNPTGVLQEKDHENNKIKCRHQFFSYNEDKKGRQTGRGPKIDYTLTIETFQGKYKYEITRINPKQSTYFGIESWIEDPKKYDYAQAYLKQIDKFMNDLIPDLKKWMKPYVEEQKGWK